MYSRLVARERHVFHGAAEDGEVIDLVIPDAAKLKSESAAEYLKEYLSQYQTKCQRAMAFAMLFPESEQNNLKSSKPASRLRGDLFSAQLLSHARVILRRSPEAAHEILKGQKGLARVYHEIVCHQPRVKIPSENKYQLAKAERLKRIVSLAKSGYSA